MSSPNDDTQKYANCKLKLGIESLNTQLNETTNQILLVQNVVIPKNKKTLFWNVRDKCNKALLK